MSTIEIIDEAEIRNNRTLHVIQRSIGNKKFVFYLYNYEGVHFRIFDNLAELIYFFNGNASFHVDFEDENEVYEYIGNIDLENCIPMNCPTSGIQEVGSPFGFTMTRPHLDPLSIKV